VSSICNKILYCTTRVLRYMYIKMWYHFEMAVPKSCRIELISPGFYIRNLVLSFGTSLYWAYMYLALQYPVTPSARRRVDVRIRARAAPAPTPSSRSLRSVAAAVPGSVPAARRQGGVYGRDSVAWHPARGGAKSRSRCITCRAALLEAPTSCCGGQPATLHHTVCA